MLPQLLFCLHRKLRRTLLAAFLFLFVVAPGSQAAQVAKFAYVVNPYDYTISSYYFDGDGVMFPNGMVYTKDKFPATLIIHPNKQYIFSASRTVDTAPIFEIDPVTGRLSESRYSRFDTRLRSPFDYEFHPNGKFLYVAGRGGGVGGYIVDEKTGAMSHIVGSPFKAGERTRNLTIHPSGNFVYASNAYTNNVSAYRVNQKTGALTQLKASPFPAGEAGPFDDTFAKLPDVMTNKGGLPYYISSHPSGKFLYVTNWAAASISVFKVNQDTGDLTLVGLPAQTGLTPYAVAVHPSGKFVYASTWGGNDVWVYRVNPETGMLQSIEGSPFQTLGMKPVDIAFNEDGSQVYVANNGSNTITVFNSDNESGKLEMVDIAMSRAGAIDVEIYSSEKTVTIVPGLSYVLDKQNTRINAYQVNPETGDLNKKASIKTGKQPLAIAHDPLNRFVYVANYGDSSVSAYSVDSKTGKLKEVEGSPYKVGDKPQDIMVDANGWYLYTLNEGSKDLSVFLIHYKTGQLAEAQGSPLAFAEQTSFISGDVTSRFVYVSSDEKKSVRVLRFRTAITPSIFEIEDHGSPFMYKSVPSAVVNDPTGHFTLVAQKEAGEILLFALQVSTGELLPIPGNEKPYKLDGREPVDAVFHPSSKYAYVLNKGSNSISQIKVGRIYGKMSKIANAVKTSGEPIAMKIDPAGNYLYVTIKGKKGLQRFSIDSTTGKLELKKDIVLNYFPEDMAISKEFR